MSEWPENPNHCYNCGRENPSSYMDDKVKALQAALDVAEKDLKEIAEDSADDFAMRIAKIALDQIHKARGGEK